MRSADLCWTRRRGHRQGIERFATPVCVDHTVCQPDDTRPWLGWGGEGFSSPRGERIDTWFWHERGNVGSTAWVARLRELYGLATSEWLASHPDAGEAPHFWELQLAIPEAWVGETAEAISHQVNAGALGDARTCSLFLLFVLRTRLTSVRGNRLWPEYAAFLSEYGQRVDAAAVADSHRRALLAAFPERLVAIRHHHRYVVLALDEAGVGWDRSRIVRDFLDHFVRLINRSPLQGTRFADFADEAVRDFVAERRDASDIRPLTEVLRRSAAAVAVIAQEIRSSGLGPSLALAGWGETRRTLLQRTGVDLDRIIPEAREAIGAIIPRLGSRLSRSAFAMLTVSGQYRVDLPVAFPLPMDSAAVPIAPASIHAGGYVSVVAIVDDSGLSAEHILATPPDQWHPAPSGGTFLWRSNPFTVATSPWSHEGSVPVFIGSTPSTAVLKGHMWSGDPGDGFPHVDGVADLPNRASVQCSWLLATDDLSLSLVGCTVPDRVSGDAVVRANGLTIWQGEIVAGHLIMEHPCILHGCQHRIAPVDLIVARNSGEILHASMVPHPLQDGCAVSVSGRVVDDATTTYMDPSDEICVVALNAAPEMHVTGAARKTIEVNNQLKRVTLVPEDGAMDLRIGGRWWRFARRPPVHLRAPGPFLTESAGLSVSSQDMVPVGPSGSMWLLLSDLTGTTDSDALREVWLEVTTTARAHRWRLADLIAFIEESHTVRPDEVAQFDLAAFAANRGVRLAPGLVSARLAGAGVAGGATLFFSLPWDSHTVSYSREGEPSELVLARDGRNLATLRSTGWDGPAATAGLRIGRSLLTLKWQPVVRDATLTPIPEGNHRLTLRDLGAGCVVRALGTEPLALEVAGTRYPLTADGIDISECLLRIARGEIGPIRVFDGAEPIRSWDVEPSPICTRLEATWVDGDLAVTLEIFALPHQDLSLHLLGESDVEVSVPVALRSDESEGIRRSMDRTLRPLRSLLPGSRSLRLEVRNARTILRAEVVMCPEHPAPDAEGLRTDLLRLVADNTSGLDATLPLLQLIDRYVALTSHLPLRIDGLLAHLPAGSHLLAANLTLVDALARGDSSPTVDLSLEGGDHELLFLFSLALAHEMRLAEEGQAARQRFHHLRERLHDLSTRLPAGSSARAWCEVMGALCIRNLGGESTVDPRLRRQAMDVPLVTFYRPLLDLVRTLPSQEVPA